MPRRRSSLPFSSSSPLLPPSARSRCRAATAAPSLPPSLSRREGHRDRAGPQRAEWPPPLTAVVSLPARPTSSLAYRAMGEANQMAGKARRRPHPPRPLLLPAGDHRGHQVYTPASVGCSGARFPGRRPARHFPNAQAACSGNIKLGHHGGGGRALGSASLKAARIRQQVLVAHSFVGECDSIRVLRMDSVDSSSPLCLAQHE
ncbi:hypothetical protein SEVIR_6G063640v4 [Setaria viridis]|uniref:Uncharacterized protein n=1 Tax=Setaria viridis TaxID=4556 RepID=A0A4U6U2G6_SETVI|nr:hypothetical protein SEVIR_6G063640v2 [Setaria viridis]TKW09013.1 hypothetical protein SEVIR_6G063640v2 [Setaria viridis]TKW09014.1 hypothetical protein SEVIR_6G063640v2 [Setaria viridis]TKW09015.1 hypothetical protein SEVIR_6G063640v2 [Setaria viridis]